MSPVVEDVIGSSGCEYVHPFDKAGPDLELFLCTIVLPAVLVRVASAMHFSVSSRRPAINCAM